MQGRPIELLVQEHVAQWTILVLAGFHGDEPKSVDLARRFLARLDSTVVQDGRAEVMVRWGVVPVVNPDGYAIRRRSNARGVDINRNWPTRDWSPGRKGSRYFGGPQPASEPETRAVLAAVRKLQPSLIVTLHSIDKHRECNNFDGPAKTFARRLSRRNGYPVRSTLGYPVPGSFGTWAGVERGIPTVTLELPSHASAKACWMSNERALVDLSRAFTNKQVRRWVDATELSG